MSENIVRLIVVACAAKCRIMVKGLYRTYDRLLGDAVRVHWSAGDAAPILSLGVYAVLKGEPPARLLPTRDEYERRTYSPDPDPFEEWLVESAG